MNSGTHEPIIRRLLVGACGVPAAERVLARAAEIASALDLEIAGRFAEEPAMRMLASLPTVRIATLTGRTDRQSEVSALASEIEIAARIMRRRVAAAAEQAGIAWSFATSRSELETVLRGGTTAGDLLLVAEGGALAGETLISALRRLEYLGNRAAGLLYLPTRIGTIANAEAVFAGSVEPALVRIAGRLAAASGGRLTIVCRTDERTAARSLLEDEILQVPQADIIVADDLRLAVDRPGGSRSRLLILRKTCLEAMAAGISLADLRRWSDATLVIADQPESENLQLME